MLSGLKSIWRALGFGKDSGSEGAIRVFPECAHLYHERCLLRWLVEHDTCPMCRRTSSLGSLNSTKDDDDDDIDNLLTPEPKSRIIEAAEASLKPEHPEVD